MKKLKTTLLTLAGIGLIGSISYGVNSYNYYRNIEINNPGIQRLDKLSDEFNFGELKQLKGLGAIVQYKTNPEFRKKYDLLVNEYIELENDSGLTEVRNKRDTYRNKVMGSILVFILSLTPFLVAYDDWEKRRAEWR